MKMLQTDLGELDATITGINAKELAELKRIKGRSKDGKLNPSDVVEAAASPKSPLHHRFDWDDSTAAAKYRLAQARNIIKCVRVQYADMQPVRYFPHVRSDTTGYRDFREVIQIAELKQSYLHQFMADIEALIRKYESFAEVSGEIKALNTLLMRIQAKLNRKKAA